MRTIRNAVYLILKLYIHFWSIVWDFEQVSTKQNKIVHLVVGHNFAKQAFSWNRFIFKEKPGGDEKSLYKVRFKNLTPLAPSTYAFEMFYIYFRKKENQKKNRRK